MFIPRIDFRNFCPCGQPATTPYNSDVYGNRCATFAIACDEHADLLGQDVAAEIAAEKAKKDPEKPRLEWPYLSGPRTLDATLTYMDFDKSLWTMIKSTNRLERYLREWRRRLRTMGALPNPTSCDRIIYALVQDYNDQQKRIPLNQKSELCLT